MLCIQLTVNSILASWRSNAPATTPTHRNTLAARDLAQSCPSVGHRRPLGPFIHWLTLFMFHLAAGPLAASNFSSSFAIRHWDLNRALASRKCIIARPSGRVLKEIGLYWALVMVHPTATPLEIPQLAAEAADAASHGINELRSWNLH